MPDGEDGDVGAEGAGLEDEGDFDQVLSDLSFAFGGAGVCDSGGAVAGHDFDEEVDPDESCEDAAWVDGREPGDVVEEAGEDEVVCSRPDGSGHCCFSLLRIQRWEIDFAYGPLSNNTVLVMNRGRLLTWNAQASRTAKPPIIRAAPTGTSAVIFQDL